MEGQPSTSTSARLTEEDVLQKETARSERIAQAEQQRQSAALAEIITSSLDKPVVLSSVRVVNSNATRSSFLSSILTPILSHHAGRGPQDLASLITLSQQINGSLAAFGIFKSVDVRLEPALSLLAGPDSVDVVVNVDEASRLSLKSGTEVGQVEGSAYITANVRNVFGGAESLAVSSSVGTKTRSAFEATFRSPLFASPLHALAISGFSNDRDNTSFASHWESAQGVKVAYEKRAVLGGHTFSYDLVQRNLRNLTPTASASIRDAGRIGGSLKSAVSYTFLRDSRDRPFLGHAGSYIKAVQELAGLGGDAFHARSTAELAFSRALSPGWYAAVTARGGLVYPLLPGKATALADRLYLGGPTSVRGFTMNGLGPRDGADSVGGDAAYSVGLSIFGPLPLRPTWPLKMHAFLNAGKLSSLHRGSLRPLVATPPSLSAGFGLAYDFAPIRIEANFAVPLVSGAGEGRAKGFQLGMGVDFL